MAKKAGKIKISKAKQKNILGGKKTKGKKTSSQAVVKARKKLVAIRKLKEKNRLLRAQGKAPQHEETTAQDVLDMLDEDELSYVRNANRIGQFQFAVQPSESEHKRKKAERGLKRKEAEDDELENRYESNYAKEMSEKKAIRWLLPVKTDKGLTMQTTSEEYIRSSAKNSTVSVPTDTPARTESENNVNQHAPQTQQTEEDESGKVISTAMLLARRQEKLNEYRMKIGILSASFLEDPDNRLRNLDSLLAMLQTNESAVAFTVPKLATISLVMVFQDVLPAYAIKHHNQEGVKLKKDTRALQGGEANLLRRYKTFLQRLEKMVTSGLPRRKSGASVSEAERKLGRVALDCMCKMLVSHPYFNMATNIVNFVIPFLNHWDTITRLIVFNAIKSVFRIDKRGEISYEIVRRINILVKSKFSGGKSGFMRRDVMDVLLELRIKEVDLEKEKVDEMTPKAKMTFEERRMLSKKNRKKAKDMVQLERELLETAAEENKAQKSHYLTEITKLVFTMYFRTLKTNPSAPMLSSVLEGLAKFAHIINIDFFEDLLRVLGKLQNSGDLKRRQSILCIATVLAVLDGQGQALTLDPTMFHKNLYAHLIQLKCGRAETDVGVALRCIRLACGKKKIPGPRATAFAKRLATIVTQLEYNDALGCLMELKNVLKMNPVTRGLLDSDGSLGSGVYLPELDNPDHCSAESSTLWEMTTLLAHYHPWVEQAVRGILKPDSVEALPKDIFHKHPEEIVTRLDPYKTMEFIPEVNIPTIPPRKQMKKFIDFQPRTEYLKRIHTAQNIPETLYAKHLDSINFSIIG